MALIRVNENQRRILLITTALAIIAGFFFLKHYLMLVIFAAIMAHLFNPVHEWLLRKGRSQGQAALITFALSMLVIIIPMIIVIIITVFQIERLVDSISTGNYSASLTDFGNDLVNSINQLLSNAGISYRVSIEQLAQNVSEAAQTFGKSLVNDVLNSLSGFISFITTAIIYIYVFMSMLRNKAKIIATVKRLNPLGDEISELYLNRTGSMTKATVRGQFIIAFMQGLESAAVLSIAGLENLFFFFLMLLTVLSLIPLGAGIVTIPIGIVMILTGNIWQGVLVIANHLLIVTNIDNVMRPRLVPKNARLDAALMILAVFSGLAFFGFLGIVIGPIIMILLITTLQIFLEVFHNIESIDRANHPKKNGKISQLRSRINLKRS